MMATVLLSGCKKLVEVEAPHTSINNENVFKSDETAISYVTGIYSQIAANFHLSSGVTSLSYYPGLSADELTLFNSVNDSQTIDLYQNNLKAGNGLTPVFWYSLYNTIYLTNSSIEGLTKTNFLTPAVKKQLLGEAKFMRAFCYFYLVNLFGDVPLVTSTDYNINATLSRTSSSVIYSFIENDLTDCQNLLANVYPDAKLLNSTTERVRPNKWTATALLARVYLYEKKWALAQTNSSAVIANSLFSLESIDNVFRANNSEAIWQLQPVNLGWNTEDAQLFILPMSGPEAAYPVYLSSSLINSFDSNDQRKSKWISKITIGGQDYSYAYKYKSATLNDPITEYQCVFRLSEQYLIRSEALLQQGDIGGCQSDMNIIRNRAGLNAITSMTTSELLNALQMEYRHEFFTEWAQRWLTLKHFGKVDEVMSINCVSKGGTWRTTSQLYPIPITEIQRDANLIQNPGY